MTPMPRVILRAHMAAAGLHGRRDTAAELSVSSTILPLESNYPYQKRWWKMHPHHGFICCCRVCWPCRMHQLWCRKALPWHHMAAARPNGSHCCAGTRGSSRGGAGGTAGAQPTPANGLTRTTLRTTSAICPHGRLCRFAQWYRCLLLTTRHACPELCRDAPSNGMPNSPSSSLVCHRLLA